MRRAIRGAAPFVLVVAVYFLLAWIFGEPTATDQPATMTTEAPSTTTTSAAPVAAGAWDHLPTDHDIALGVLAAIPTPTTTTPTPVELAPPASATRTVTPPAPPAPAGSIEAAICSVDWPCERARSVARCESGLNPNAVGGAGERGLFQIHPVHRARLGTRWELLFDPAVNVEVAHEMWLAQGWAPWSCAR